MKKLLTIALVLVAVAGMVFAQAAAEDNYPNKNINLIVPYGAGGTTDLTARAIANGMAKQLGVTINVNNVAGSGGAIGSLQVQNAAVDGYTILANGMLAFTTMPIQGFTDKTFREWDIWLATYAPNAIVVPADSPFNTIIDLVEAMRANPGQITFGTAGISTGGHFGAEAMKAIAGADYKHVTYNGGGPAVNGILAGEVQVCSQLLAEVKDHIISGALKCLCVLSEEDIEIAPGVICESITKYYPEESKGYVPMGEVTGFCVPKGLPESTLAKLDAAFEYAVAQQEVADFCELKSFSLIPMNREESQAYLESFTSRVAYLLWDAGAVAIDPATVGINR